MRSLVEAEGKISSLGYGDLNHASGLGYRYALCCPSTHPSIRQRPRAYRVIAKHQTKRVSETSCVLGLTQSRDGDTV